MIGAPGLKEVVESMTDFLNEHGDMPIAFHDVRGNFHDILGQSLGTDINSGDKMFVLRGYNAANKPKGVRIGKNK